MGGLPTQSVGTDVAADLIPGPRGETAPALLPALLKALWQASEAEACGLTRLEFAEMVLAIGMERNFGLTSGLPPEATPADQAAFFAGLRIADLVLARACAAGNERAWERFIALYRQPLLRAGMAIANNETLGRELADGLYAELYGLTVREGERRCPLESYSGRGSLLGWLRTTLAQRHVDQHRRTHREQPLDEPEQAAEPVAPSAPDPEPSVLPAVRSAVEEALERQGPEERFLLASYFLDGRRLHEIAAVLGVHEATVSRKLKRATAEVRKQIVRGLERKGMSRREAEEALEVDPRDLTANLDSEDRIGGSHLRLKELLQSSATRTFKEQAER